MASLRSCSPPISIRGSNFGVRIEVYCFEAGALGRSMHNCLLDVDSTAIQQHAPPATQRLQAVSAYLRPSIDMQSIAHICTTRQAWYCCGGGAKSLSISSIMH